MKRAVNRFLDQATGHMLVRTTNLDGLKRKSADLTKQLERQLKAGAKSNQKELAATRAELQSVRTRFDQATAALEKQVKRIETLTKPKPAAAPQLPADYDNAFKEIWPKVKERTMNTHEKLNFVYSAVRYVEAHGIPGAIVECGVWRGGSMLTVAHTLEQLGVDNRDLYLFDTFSGMTEPSDRDVHVWAKKSATEIVTSGDKTAAKMFIPASLDDVRAGFDDLSYPADRIHYIEGPVEETIPEHAPDQIAILRLDTDWYESTKHELDHLYSRLAPGGVLIIDDYGSWQGSRDATDEFLTVTGEPLLLTRISRTRAAVKPGLASQVSWAR